MSNKLITTVLFVLCITTIASAAISKVTSPSNRISVELVYNNMDITGEWVMNIAYNKNAKVDLTTVKIGLKTNEHDFSKNLVLLKTGKTKSINENYTSIHGKKSLRQNSGNELVFYFENSQKTKMNLIIRAYNDGVAFRYEFPDKEGSYIVNDELTSYIIPSQAKRWLEKFDLSNEGLYASANDAADQQNWCYPALFNTEDEACWYLIHEADVDRNYCATKLSNINTGSAYKVTLPHPNEGEGEALPKITLPWKSPWRVIIIGSLADIVESTLVDDVSTPSKLENTNWIKPGLVSWNYWSDNHGTKDYQIVCDFADLAAEMNWPYTLLDWEWDEMENGGNVEDAAKYILSKGVKPLIWYNSSMFKWITSTPIDRMKTHESRVEEFTWLKKHGFAGVKIDFFLSEKQYMIDYYLDILEDAAQFEMLVYFHGCIVPRGWARTYPHLMTYEGVRGAEWYNNGPDLTTTAPKHNTVLPFTRNVVGSMDYTPVTFTNSQFPHITSYGHELALSIVFESALQHMADRPEGYRELPDAPKSFLKDIPSAWDNTKFISGYPGNEVVIARQKGDNWYIGGITSAERKENIQHVELDFLQEGLSYKLTLISDGQHDKAFSTTYMVVDNSSSFDVKLLRRGGFVASLKPLQ